MHSLKALRHGSHSFTNKVDAVSDITDKRLDVLAIQETWYTTIDDTCRRLVTPAGYAIVDAARTTGTVDPAGTL